jgi:hypothetical protein
MLSFQLSDEFFFSGLPFWNYQNQVSISKNAFLNYPLNANSGNIRFAILSSIIFGPYPALGRGLIGFVVVGFT